MPLTLTEYTRVLSARDRKSLSQKALKAAEEVGELARAVLPFDGAHATTHRFIDRRKILEESCDVVLTALSIAYDMGFTDQDIDEMLMRKAQKWDDLQAREAKAQYPLPYEIHVTVAEAEVPRFRTDCEALGVKPIFLDLHLSGGGSMNDVMTSSAHLGDNASALDELQRISVGLKQAGYSVVREKIETVPWHPAAPSRGHAEPVMPKDCYFESHINIICSDARRSDLATIASESQAHLSRNAFKRIDAELFTVMMTLRRNAGTREGFLEEMERLSKRLADAGFEFEEAIVEFSIYDTRVRHDSVWTGTA